MQIENEYETDDETRLYATDPEWVVGLNDPEEERIQIGVYAQIENLHAMGLETMSEEYPIGISFCVVVHNPKVCANAVRSCSGYEDDEIAKMSEADRQHFARETLLAYQGGVPADVPLYHGIHRHGDSGAFQALVDRYEGKIKVIDGAFGRPVLAFAEWEDAEDCARFILEDRAPALCGPIIGFFLDAPINRIGQVGWSMIISAVEGQDWDPVPAGVRFAIE